MSKPKFRVVKTTIKTGCDLEREIIRSNLPRGKAEALKAVMESQVETEVFNPHSMACFTIEPAA